jgi:hypothetical protein
MEFLKKNWVAALALIAIILAISFNRPVKVSVLENVYIEVGAGEAGPPVKYDQVIDMEDGRKIFVTGDSCTVKE